jgi:hypothetical protein
MVFWPAFLPKTVEIYSGRAAAFQENSRNYFRALGSFRGWDGRPGPAILRPLEKRVTLASQPGRSAANGGGRNGGTFDDQFPGADGRAGRGRIPHERHVEKRRHQSLVMARLVPGTRVERAPCSLDPDERDRPSHDPCDFPQPSADGSISRRALASPTPACGRPVLDETGPAGGASETPAPLGFSSDRGVSRRDGTQSNRKLRLRARTVL